MPTPVTIQVKLDSKQAEAGAAKLRKTVSGVFTAIRESVGQLNAQMRELTFSPAGILRGTDQAVHGLQAVQSAVQEAISVLGDLKKQSEVSGESLAVLGDHAEAAEGKLTTLSSSTGTVGTALTDMATGASEADAALLSLEEGAGTAQKAVSGLGRVTANLLKRFEGLNEAVFDPSDVVAGADASTAALERLRMAAAEAKASLRGASSGSPIFVGGGRHGSGAAGAAEEAEAGTFAGGLRAGAGAAGDLAGGGAALVTILAAVTGKLSAGFDNMLQGVKGNTTMTDADGQRMRRTTLGLMRTGTNEEEIAKAYGHVENMNYTGRDADAIVTQANKMGIATHTNVEDTGQVLARLLKEYNQPASRVKAVAETAHLTSAGGDMYLKEFDQYAGKAFATGANSKVSMPEVAAMLRALTQHGLDIAKASTQAVGLITQMRNPTPQAAKYAQSIGLGGYLGAKALEKYQPSGILAAVAEKTGGDPQKIGNIFKARQGGLGAAVLTGMGKSSYDDALNNTRTGTKAAFAGKTNAIDPLFNAQMKQTQQQFAALGGEIKSDFIPIGERLGPVFAAAIPLIRTTASVVRELLDGFTKLPRPVQEAVLGLGALKLVSSFLPLLGGFALISERTTVVLGGLGKMLLGLGGAAAEGEAGIAGTGALLSGPFALGVLAAVAAVAALVLAWKTDFGGIREVTASVSASVRNVVATQFGGVVKWFQTNLPLIRETVKTVLSAIQVFWHDHGQRIMAIIGPMWDLIKQTFVNAIHLVEQVIKLGMDIITGHWRSAGLDVVAIVRTLFSELGVIVVNGAKIVGNAFALLVSGVYDILKRAVLTIYGLGKQLVDGLVNGIKSGIGAVGSAVKSLADSAIGGITTALDIHSPSRVMHKLGLNTAEGLAQGIRDGKVSVEQASRMLANTPAAIVRSAISQARRGQSAAKKREGEVHAAGEFAATVGETPEQRELHKLSEDRAKGLVSAGQYAEAYARIKRAGNKAEEGEAKRHAAALAQIHDELTAFTDNPDTPSLDKQEASAHAEYHRQIKDLGGDRMGPYTKPIETGMKDAGTLLQDKLNAIAAQRKAKSDAEAQTAQDEADAAEKQAQATTVQLNRELWQHAGGDMKAYFQSLRDEADQTLKGVTDKFGPASTHPNAPAVQAATDQHAAQIAVIAQQQTDAENQLADSRQEHDLAQGKITLANYIDYLTRRRDAYQQYSQEWLDIDSRLYSADEEMQKKQLQSIEDLFQAHKISLEAYKKMLGDLAAQVPVASAVHQDVVSAQNGAENRANRGEIVGGQDFWDGLAGSASENGSRVLTALLHPKDKKKIFKSLWEDLIGSLEGSVTGQFSKLLKNALTGGLNLGSLFGGLFGGNKKTASTAPGTQSATQGNQTAPSGQGYQTAWGGLVPSVQFGSGGRGLSAPSGVMSLLGTLFGKSLPGIENPGITQYGGGGLPKGNLLNVGIPGNILGQVQGINGAINPLAGKGLGAGLDIASLAASFLPGGSLLAKLFKGGLFGGLGKLFHFSAGGIVPGLGDRDSVPAMLTPGEIVLPKALSAHLRQAAIPQAPTAESFPARRSAAEPQGRATGDVDRSLTIHQYGNHIYNNEMDAEKAGRAIARVNDVKRRNMTPAF